MLVIVRNVRPFPITDIFLVKLSRSSVLSLETSPTCKEGKELFPAFSQAQLKTTLSTTYSQRVGLINYLFTIYSLSVESLLQSVGAATIMSMMKILSRFP